MSFNRNKILAKAQKLLQKGKVSEAIVEYEEVVRNDPADIRTLLKIGDLHAKLGNIEAATSTYQKVGEFYAKDGFFLKAVAVFKQILKLDPGLILVYLRLAELYQNLGLSSDAIKQYQVVARHYESQGLMKESLDVLRKISELEPENFVNRVKLAELYCREGHKEDGRKQFLSILSVLEGRKNYPELVRVYEKLVALELQEEDVELKLVDAYLHNAEPKKALIRLQKLFQKNPRDIPILTALAQCFIDLGQPEKSKSVYLEIMSILDKENRPQEKDAYVAKLRALNVMAQSATAAEAASHADTAAAAPLRKPTAKILDEVDMYAQYGLNDKALRLLEDSLLQAPGDAELLAKFMASTRVMEAAPVREAIGRLLESNEIRAQAGARDELARYAAELSPAAPEPALAASEEGILDLGLPDADPTGGSAEFERSPMDAFSLETELADSRPEEAPAPDEAVDFDLDLDADPQIAASLDGVLDHADGPTGFAPAAAPGAGEFLPEAEAPLETPPFESADAPLAFDPVDPAPAPVAVAIEPEKSISVDLAHEYEVAEPLGAPAPAVEISLEAPLAPPDEPFIEFSLGEEPAAPAPEVPVAVASPPDVAALMREAADCAERGDLERARELYVSVLVADRNHLPAVDGLARLVAPKPAPPAAPAKVGAQSASELFDLSVELREEIHDLESQLSRPKNADEAYLSPEEVISEFKKGVARTVAKDDYQTHYNLGIAYKEMGLLDEAIQEFGIADQDPSLHVNAISMIGLCMTGKKDFAPAIALYKKTLQELPPVHSPEVLGLSYELAEAFVGAGHVAEAYKLFAKVAEFDPNFRDARARAKELAADFAQDGGANKVASLEKAAKKNKVSYV